MNEFGRCMESFEERLRIAGLTGNEARVYYELLRKGSLSANELAKKISMDRTLAYTVLNHLIEKGLVTYVMKSSKKFFEATEPVNLLHTVREQEAYIKNLIPDLEKLEQIKESSHEINVYEGKEGLRSFMRLVMKYPSISSFGATGRAYDAFYESPHLVKETIKRGFTGRIILNPEHRDHQITKIKNLSIKYLNVKSEATTTIFGEYVSIHLLVHKPIVIVIKNKEIAESYKNYFEFLWNAAKA